MPDPVAFRTRAAHAGRGAPPRTVSRPLTPPIYQSTVYAFDRLEDLEALYAGAPGRAIATAAVLALAGAGDRIVADRHAYGGTYTLLADELPRLGIDVALVAATDLAQVERALESGARALLVEALSNPTLRVVDVPALCALGRAH